MPPTETYEFVGGPLDGEVRAFCFDKGVKTVSFPYVQHRNFERMPTFGKYVYRIDGKFLRFGSTERASHS